MSYCTRLDIENLFGTENIKLWSNLDNSTAEADVNRINAAIAYAGAKIDSALRGGMYAIPLVLADESVLLVADLAARLAGVWLYESRGVRDVDANGHGQHRLKWHAERADQTLRQIQAGVIYLRAAILRTSPNIPMQPNW